MTPEEKVWIDNASYEVLLRKWRFAPCTDEFFQGETGTYMAKVMTEKRSADPRGAIAASKRIGWSL